MPKRTSRPLLAPGDNTLIDPKSPFALKIPRVFKVDEESDSVKTVGKTTSPLASNITPVFKVDAKADGVKVITNGGEVSVNHNYRLCRKRKRSVSKERSESECEDVVQPHVDAPAISSSPKPDIVLDGHNYCEEYYTGCICNEDTLRKHLDCISKGCESLHLDANHSTSGPPDVLIKNDLCLPDDLSVLPASLPGDKKVGSEEDVDDSDSVSDHSNKDEEDSNDEDNWRNDYPDEDDFNEKGHGDYESDEYDKDW